VGLDILKQARRFCGSEFDREQIHHLRELAQPQSGQCVDLLQKLHGCVVDIAGQRRVDYRGDSVSVRGLPERRGQGKQQGYLRTLNGLAKVGVRLDGGVVVARRLAMLPIVEGGKVSPDACLVLLWAQQNI
jgi:hypothetical protein